MPDLLLYVLIGFFAQLVDGALGMAYGVTASTFLLSFGVPPAVSSATVHAAECITTGTSGLWHHFFGNIDRALFKQLVIPGILGGVSGAYFLTSFPGDVLKPWVALYLLILGVRILAKAWNGTKHRRCKRVHLLGLAGGFLDAVGGGGWGPIVTGTLVGNGHHPARSIGTVNAVEFFVTVAASIVFLFTLGLANLPIILSLAVGGFVAAPFGAMLCNRLPSRALLAMVGSLIITLSIRTLILSIR